MKNIIITTIAFLLFMASARTQHINLGVKGGLNAFSIAGDNSSANNTKLSYNLGLMGHIHLNSYFAFQPELMYSVQGTGYNNVGDDRKLNLNYINIPLNLQYMFDNGFRIQAGPQIGILANANLVTGNNSLDVIENYKRTDLGLTVGVSYVKPSTGYGIDLRYNQGLTNINASDASNSYNRGLQLAVFYLFQHRS